MKTVDVHNTSEVLFRLCANTDPQRACRAEALRRRDSIFTKGPSAVLDHATSEMAIGSKLGIDATKKLSGEGFKRPWPPLIKMENVVKVCFMRGLALLLLAFVPSCATYSRTKYPSELQTLVNSELQRFPGHAGVYVKNLKTGEEAGFRADEIFNSASVIKLPVAALALEKTAHGELNLDERIPLRKEDLRGGTGVLQFHDPGLEPTLRDIVFEMIITSDNTATDIAIERAGGVAAVNDWIKAHGYGNSLHLTQTLRDCFAKYAPLFAAQEIFTNDPASLQRAGNATKEDAKRTIEDRDWWIGEITPRGIGKFLEDLERREMLPPEKSDLLLKMLDAQQGGACRLPHYLPWPEYTVAHKTGDWPPVLANDVGIIHTHSGTIIIAFCANAIHGNYGEAEDCIGHFARKIVDYFERAPGQRVPTR